MDRGFPQHNPRARRVRQSNRSAREISSFFPAIRNTEGQRSSQKFENETMRISWLFSDTSLPVAPNRDWIVRCPNSIIVRAIHRLPLPGGEIRIDVGGFGRPASRATRPKNAHLTNKGQAQQYRVGMFIDLSRRPCFRQPQSVPGVVYERS